MSQNDNIMILINFNSVNTIFEKISIYDNFVNFKFSCPKCNSHSFSFFGYYNRNFMALINNKPSVFNINIKRVICKTCKATHALIPNFIIPYKIYSKDTIIFCLQKSNDLHLLNIQDIFNVDRQLILNWKKQFNLYLNFISTFYSIFDTYTILNNLSNDINFCFDFFIKFRKIFLLNHLGSIFNYIST